MLIQCFCDDLGVKPQQVAQTLKHDQNQPPRSKLEWICLEPVLAASDYNLFTHMMMRKNIELQLQALQMIEVLTTIQIQFYTLFGPLQYIFTVLCGSVE